MTGSERHDRKTGQRRQWLLDATVRLLVQDPTLDAHAALRKAMRRTGIHEPAARPDIDAINRALHEHRRLFGNATPDPQPLWGAAIEAMQALQQFSPRLCEEASAATIRLHLHCDTPESVAQWLIEHRIPARARDRRLRLDRHRVVEVPTWEFDAGNWPVELWVLPELALRQTPLAAGTDQPQPRLSIAALRSRLDAGT